MATNPYSAQGIVEQAKAAVKALIPKMPTAPAVPMTQGETISAPGFTVSPNQSNVQSGGMSPAVTSGGNNTNMLATVVDTKKPVQASSIVATTKTTSTPTAPDYNIQSGAGNPDSSMGAGGVVTPTGSNANVYGSGTDARGAYTLDSAGNKVYGQLSPEEIKALNPDISGLVSSTNDPTDGTSSLRQADLDAYNEQQKALLKQAELNRQGIFTDAQQSQIADASKAIAAQFDAMIGESEAERTRGMGRAIIGAGQHGGLMNSQFAGAAALPGVQVAPGGPSNLPGATSGFIGAGGEFERIESSYTNTINKLKSQKEAAIATAEAAAKQAILTGNSEQFAQVQKMIENARTQYTQGIADATAKAEYTAKVFENNSNQAAVFAQDKVTIGKDGTVTKPTPAEIAEYAKANKMDVSLVNAMVNQQADKYEALSLDQLKTMSEIWKNTDANATNKPLSASDLKNYTDMGYMVFPGMTAADVAKLQPISGNMTKEQKDALFKLSDDAQQQPPIKQFPDIQSAYQNALEASKKNDGLGDLTMLRYLAKVTDPTTGIREEEYKTFAGAQGDLKNRMVYLSEGIWNGRKLTDSGRVEVLQKLEDIYNQKKSQYLQAVGWYDNQAKLRYGISPGNVAPDYSTNTGSNNGSSSGSSADQFPDL